MNPIRRHPFFWIGLVSYCGSMYSLAVFALMAFSHAPPGNFPDNASLLDHLALIAMSLCLYAAPVTFIWGLWTGGRIHGAVSWSAVVAGPAAAGPGRWSSQRHWHSREDEFVFVLEGELLLVENDEETLLQAGDCAAFPKGSGNGHHLRNTGSSTAVSWRRKDGTPYDE